MLSILTSWFIIYFTLFSFGSMLLSIYNKFCKHSESYNFLDTFLLGLCFICITLPLSSLWFPSNHYILLTYITCCIVYWGFNRNKLRGYAHSFQQQYKSVNTSQKIIITSVILTIIAYMLVSANFHDAWVYQRQHVRWNEEFAVVPGLANLEDRFGFNSNYLLVSAVFSLRFLFGQAVYGLQSALLVYLICWTFLKLFKSQYEIRYLILLVLTLLLTMICAFMLPDTNTDIIPILCIFYYIVKTTFDPDWLKKQPLMAFLLPIMLITFKLSTGIFVLIPIGIMFYLIKQKQYRTMFFLCSCAFLIVALWCTRNAVISGYLIYPLYKLDLFSFDWKVPMGTTLLENIHTYHWAEYVFDNYLSELFNKDIYGSKFTFLIKAINYLFYLLALISSIVMFTLLAKKKVNKIHFYIHTVSILCILFVIVTAPDFRFANGYIIGSLFLFWYVLLSLFNREKQSIPKLGTAIMIAFLALLFVFVFIEDRKSIKSLDIKFCKEDLVKMAIVQEKYFLDIDCKEYSLGNFHILVTDWDTRTFDLFPATNSGGIPFDYFRGDKLQDVRTIEARGESLNDGFRTKKEYIEIINNNIEEYKKEYLSRYPKYKE